jgi:hypothetical protein
LGVKYEKWEEKKEENVKGEQLKREKNTVECDRSKKR